MRVAQRVSRNAGVGRCAGQGRQGGNRMRLSGKVAVVTGSSSGIGRAIAVAFGREGASVVVNYRGHEDEGREVAREIESSGGKAIAVYADVAEEEDVANLVGSAVESFGGLDIMVNNAGIEHRAPLVETSLEGWERVLKVNLTGVFLGLREAAKRMIEVGGGGRIVNISSVHEDRPMPGNSPYCAAKGGVRMLMRNASVELAGHGITVNNIAPGAVETPINDNLDDDPEQKEELLAEIPLGRIGRPEEIAAMALYLASDDSAYVTGSTLFIDGGMMRHASGL